MSTQSTICFHGRPILPPLLTDAEREQLNEDRRAAVRVVERLEARRAAEVSRLRQVLLRDAQDQARKHELARLADMERDRVQKERAEREQAASADRLEHERQARVHFERELERRRRAQLAPAASPSKPLHAGDGGNYDGHAVDSEDDANSDEDEDDDDLRQIREQLKSLQRTMREKKLKKLQHQQANTSLDITTQSLRPQSAPIGAPMQSPARVRRTTHQPVATDANSLRPPTSSGSTAAKLHACARGYLTRSLYRSFKVRELRRTVYDCERFADGFADTDTMSSADQLLVQRVWNQLSSAKLAVYNIFFSYTSAEQMLILQRSRELEHEQMIRSLTLTASMRSNSSTNSSSVVANTASTPVSVRPISVATQRARERRLQQEQMRLLTQQQQLQLTRQPLRKPTAPMRRTPASTASQQQQQQPSKSRKVHSQGRNASAAAAVPTPTTTATPVAVEETVSAVAATASPVSDSRIPRPATVSGTRPAQPLHSVDTHGPSPETSRSMNASTSSFVRSTYTLENPLWLADGAIARP